MKTYFLFSFFLMITFQTAAQEYNYKNFTVNDGLAGNTVYHVFQDSKKYIWFATESGVTRFDGKVFRNFSRADGLPDNEVLSIHEDSKGRIWFLTFNGTPAYFYNDSIYSFANSPVFKRLKINSFFSCFYEDEAHTIWLGTFRNGILKISSEGKLQKQLIFDSPLVYKDCFKIFRNTKGETLTAGYDKVVNINRNQFCVDYDFRKDANFPRFSEISDTDTSFVFSHGSEIVKWNIDVKGTPQHLITIPDSARPLYIYANTGNYYVCSTNGVYIISQKTNEITGHLFTGKFISSVLMDHENNFWFSSLNEGIFFMESTYTVFKNFTKTNGLSENIVSSVLKDNAGNLWVGENNIINILSPGKKIRKIILNETLKNSSNKVISILQNQVSREVWVLTETATHIFRNFNLVKTITPAKNISISRQGITYFSIIDYLCEMEGDRISHRTYTAMRFNTIAFDKKDQLWMGNKKGLYKFTANKLIPYYELNTLLSSPIKILRSTAQITYGWRRTGTEL